MNTEKDLKAAVLLLMACRLEPKPQSAVSAGDPTVMLPVCIAPLEPLLVGILEQSSPIPCLGLAFSPVLSFPHLQRQCYLYTILTLTFA